MEPARGSWLPWKHMHFSICRKRSSFHWLCTPVLCPTTGFGVTTDCSKHPEKPSLSVVGCSGGDGFCDLAGGQSSSKVQRGTRMPEQRRAGQLAAYETPKSSYMYFQDYSDAFAPLIRSISLLDCISSRNLTHNL